MPLNIPDGFAEVTVLMSLTGDPEVMTVAYGVNYATGTNAQDLADSQDSAWAVSWGAMSFDNYTYLGVHVVLNTGGTLTEAEASTPTVGDTAGNPLPQNAAFLVKKVTGVAGRANRGRFYFPPIFYSEGAVSPVGMLDALSFAGLVALVDALYTELTTDANVDELVVLHTDALATPTVITGFLPDQQIATQRRRLRG